MQWKPYSEIDPTDKMRQLLLDIEILEGDEKGFRFVVPVGTHHATREQILLYNGAKLADSFAKHKILYYCRYPGPNLDGGSEVKPAQ